MSRTRTPAPNQIALEALQAAFRDAQQLAQHACLTTSALPNSLEQWDSLWRAIEDVQDTLVSERCREPLSLWDELERLIDDPEVLSAVLSALVTEKEAAYLYGLALGLQFKTCGAQ